eukprot:TRINITY_DN62012_c0_g1_i1.p1 TRINITY_DN62012_c0_g1~~TRINITY_DN62012_c0_g1_i1.p1  ORF type:complete len:299 (+),score=28.42 TRINITY_DN62012_c0_g1_i1:106-1002(+)
MAPGVSQISAGATDFTSDVGRKRFGFSHEEVDEVNAYYEGQFKFYSRCGEGTLHSPETGAKYVGQFLNDQFHGKGDQTWPDGSRYVGEWTRGQKHGHAYYTSAEGLTYIGQWEDGRRHGQGEQTYANKDRYKGWWYHGLCSGVGTYFFADGSRYQGIWANGRYDGSGVLYGADGSRERHSYSNGSLIKREVLPKGSVTKADGRRDVLTRNAKVVMGQARDEMHRPTVLSKQTASRFLIRRETAGLDLSAPPLKPKTAPARPYDVGAGGLEMEAPFPELRPLTPRTAPAHISSLLGPLD